MTSFADKCSTVGRWLLIIIVVFVCVYAYFAIKAYSDHGRRVEISELLQKISSLKGDYAEKLLTEGRELNSDALGLKVYDLKNYGLNTNELIKSKENNAGTFNYNRKIELTQNQIIVTFGKGFDGDSEKTFIVEVASISEEGIRWSCTGGSLSSKYRPESCKK